MFASMNRAFDFDRLPGKPRNSPRRVAQAFTF
jgi:hypothetical protein